MEPLIRPATPVDSTGIASIYAHYVLNSPATFETTPPTPSEMAARIEKVMTQFPWLVVEDESSILGYAYGSSHRDRAAYRWSVDVSIYLEERARSRGLGRRLYRQLLSLLESQGYFRVIAGITLPNDASVRLHESMGFESVGIYRSVGYKLGAWHDTGWYQLELRKPVSNPAEPIPWFQVEA